MIRCYSISSLWAVLFITNSHLKLHVSNHSAHNVPFPCVLFQSTISPHGAKKVTEFAHLCRMTCRTYVYEQVMVSRVWSLYLLGFVLYTCVWCGLNLFTWRVMTCVLNLLRLVSACTKRCPKHLFGFRFSTRLGLNKFTMLTKRAKNVLRNSTCR